MSKLRRHGFLLFFLSLSILRAAPACFAEDRTMSESANSAPVNSATTNRPLGDKWALVVGISNFQSSDIPKLTYASKDARDFADYLIQEAGFAPDHVRLLIDEKASERRVMSELGNKFLARVARPDDLVVLFFSTHGSPAQMDLRGRNYIVAYDSDPQDLYATGIQMDQVLESIQSRVLSDRVLLLLDACHSGGAAVASKGMMRVGNFDAAALAQGSGQMVICSSSPEEQSWESARYKNGVFTKQLLDGLKSKGTTTKLGEAFVHLKTKVSQEVREDRPGARQTPILSSKWNGEDLVLSTPVNSRALPEEVLKKLEPDSFAGARLAFSSPQTNSPATTSSTTIRRGMAPAAKLHVNLKYFSLPAPAQVWVKQYTQAIKVDPKNPEGFYQRALGLMHLGKLVEAHNDLQQAIRNTPNGAKFHLALGLVHHLRGNDVSAIDEVKTAIFYDFELPKEFDFQD